MKRWIRYGLAATSIATALSVAAPSSAATMLATFTGVASGVDQSNLFGLGTDFSGVSFVAQFTYDTSLGQSETTDGYDARYGGPGFGGGVSPILSASLTLNGVTDHFDVGQDGSANVFSQGGWAQTYFYTDYFSDLGSISTWDYIELYVLGAPDPTLLTTPYFGTGLPLSDSDLQDEVAHRSTYSDGSTVDYSLNLDPQTVTLAPIPEPQTWMLLLGGFFGLGAMLRQRRRTAPVAVAQ